MIYINSHYSPKHSKIITACSYSLLLSLYFLIQFLFRNSNSSKVKGKRKVATLENPKRQFKTVVALNVLKQNETRQVSRKLMWYTSQFLPFLSLKLAVHLYTKFDEF